MNTSCDNCSKEIKIKMDGTNSSCNLICSPDCKDGDKAVYKFYCHYRKKECSAVIDKE